MRWRIKISHRVEKFAQKHPDSNSTLQKIFKTLAHNPYDRTLDITKLVNKSGVYYRVRFGSNRVVFNLDKETKTINFTAADARGGMYKNKK